MNAVEIEEAVSDLVAQPFNADEFPFQFLAAFGAKDTTLKRLRKGESNASDVASGVLQRNNIHIAVARPGEVGAALAALRASPKTASAKAKFVLATDGESVEAEDLASGEALACAYAELPRHFGLFLPLAGISTVKEIKNNPIDVKATGRLNRLYVELLKDNPDWGTEARRHELNQFMARLIFCFFAEDTGIFREGSFTATVSQMSHAGHGSGEDRWGNTHEVLQHLFLAMDTPVKHEGKFDDRHRRAAAIRPWADVFPYVNGGMFGGARECPRFSRTARAYLLRAGELDWKEINPDIFGSMIQAVADDDERGDLGMHYTSVPNILKVLNPLFLDDLREQLQAAGDSKPKLRNLRRRLANIRVFDPACGSGNFLVIAYKEMRAIEAEIVNRLGGEANLKLEERRSVIPLANFYGIEIKDFAAEIARLALLIAEFQADCLYLSQQEARAMVLPLHRTGQITVGNALRLDWLEVCPSFRNLVAEHDLAGPTGRFALELNELGDKLELETYICGNPPYAGKGKKTDEILEDMKRVLSPRLTQWGYIDLVGCWLVLAADYCRASNSAAAFVATNSICQGRQLPQLWPMILSGGIEIHFAHLSFKWSNNATDNAGVICVIVGIGGVSSGEKKIYDAESVRRVNNINAYLLGGRTEYVDSSTTTLSPALSPMLTGSVPNDGGNYLFSLSERAAIVRDYPRLGRFLKPYLGAEDFIQGGIRYCLDLSRCDDDAVWAIPEVKRRLRAVQMLREKSPKKETRDTLASVPHRFQHRAKSASKAVLIIPRVSSERRPYLPVGLLPADVIVSDQAFCVVDPPLWNMAIVASRMHLVWVATVCGKMKSDYRYSNSLGWNTFPLPPLTEQNLDDLTRRAENILLAREAHFPATVADLYDPNAMPDELRRAHDENDEVLERIYIGRRFRNDTERLEKLFELYTRIKGDQPQAKKGRKAA